MLNRPLRYLMCGLSLINVALPAVASPAPMTSATEFKPEEVRVEVLGDHRDQNWFWAWGSNAPSMASGRVLLFDDSGRNLGQLSTGMWFNSLVPSRKRDELYAVETYFSRGVRGERTDVVTIYDSKTLSPKREIAIPAKRMTALISTGLSALSDDDRFLLVFNFTPAQSVSIVDLENNRFVKEVATPGCAAMYSAGPRDFYSICGNGAFLRLKLDDQGEVIKQERSAPLFDPLQDLLLTTGSRKGNTWYFVSQKNFAYGLQMSASGIAQSQRWSLVSDQERAEGWGVAGNHGTALHEKSGRLYVLMHQDKPENYQKPGTEVWVYDTKTQQRVSRIKLNELSVAIAVSKGEQPRLYSLDWMVPMPAEYITAIYTSKGEAGLMPLMRQSINLYDADSGKHLRSIDEIPAGAMNEVMSW